MNRIYVLLFILWLGYFPVIPACAGPVAPRVVVTLRPLHSLVANVMQGMGEPILLVSKQTSDHHILLTPSEVKLLHSADMIFAVSPHFETFLTRYLPASSSPQTFVALENTPGITFSPIRTGTLWQQGDEDGMESRPALEGTYTPERLPTGYSKDPHIWLSIANAQKMVGYIAEQLSNRYPSYASKFRDNAIRTSGHLAQLHSDTLKEFSSLSRQPYLVYHDAFQYYEKEYHLSSIGAITVEPHIAPGAKRIHQLREAIKTYGITCIYTEPTAKNTLLTTLMEEKPIKVIPLDPLGTTLTPGPTLYFSLMENLRKAFQQCFLPTPHNPG